jgi:hypothetical protein
MGSFGFRFSVLPSALADGFEENIESALAKISYLIYWAKALLCYYFLSVS